MVSYTMTTRLASEVPTFEQVLSAKNQPLVSVEQPQTPPNELLPIPKSFRDEPFERTAQARIEDLPGTLPTVIISDSVDHVNVAETCVDRLNSFEPSILTDDAIWRDIFALTGTLRTFAGVQHITDAWTDLFDYHRPYSFELMPGTSKIFRAGPTHSWIAARFTFKTAGIPATVCSGQIGIVPFGNDWKIWMITSILEELQGSPNPDFLTESGAIGTQITHDRAIDYEVIVVGAGFAGLCLAGRLKAMGIHYLVIERNESIGDNWTKRYDSARFHTSKYYSDMPLSPIFREGYDYFPSASDLARGYQEYVDKHRLNISLSTALHAAQFSENTKLWTIEVEREGQRQTMTTPNVVFAVGAGGSIPIWPELKNRENFKGTLLHSASYKNSHKWKGKVGVVIGSANTAHDVAEDMLDAGMSVTMCQRGRTAVIPVQYYKKWSDVIYNPTVPIEEADRQVMATPVAITRQLSLLGQRALAAKDPERFDALERRGFRCERNADLWKLLSDRLGGHYM